jgi:hypothetical protein
MKAIIRIFIPLTLLMPCAVLYSQQISRDVVVIKPYEPTISDAVKINDLPRNDDTLAFTPSFKYNILPSGLTIGYEPKAIKPAKMTIPLTELYNSYIKAGLGNYFTPLAEYGFSSRRSKDHAIGAYLMHKSSHSKLKLDNKDKVPAGYSNSYAGLSGKKIYDNVDLEGNIRLKNDGIHYYGYNTEMFADTFPEIRARDIRQRYFLFGTSADIYSTNLDSSRLNYGIGIQYDYFSDKFKNRENILALRGNLSGSVVKMMLGMDASLVNYLKSQSIDSINNTVIRLMPWLSKRTPEWEADLGFNVYVDILDKSKTYIFPRANVRFNMLEEVIIPYFGIDGRLDVHDYSTVTAENMFVVPGLNVENSVNKFIIYAGLKGKLSPVTAFRFDVTYSLFNDMHFFVNDTSGDYWNQFTVVYDDLEQIKYHGEISLGISEKLNMMIKGSYYKYVTFDEEKAWHKPEYNIDFYFSYNLRNKILFDMELIAIGNRYAKSFQGQADFIRLEPVIDLNFAIEYRYSKILSFFISLCNITSSEYYMWNQYPAQRFNMLAGFTYKL